MKGFYTIVLAAASILSSTNATAQAQRTEVDGVVYALYEYNSTAGAVGVSAGSKAVTVVASVEKDGKTYKVEMIEDNFAADNNDLTEVRFADGIKYLGIGVLRNCKNLTTVIIPSSVEAIFEEAFDGCTSLKQKPTV